MPRGKAKARRQATTPPSKEAEKEPVMEYERRRQERIRENQARLEALGLPALSSSLLEGARTLRKDGGNETRKKRRRDGNDDGDADDEYRPSDEGPSSQSESDREEERRDREKGSSSGTPRKRKNKVIPIGRRSRKKLFDECSKEESNIDDEDTALAQAIALSLGELVNSDGTQSTYSQKSHIIVTRNGNDGKESCLENVGSGKKKKENTRRVQMTEDEAVAYFFSFDEAGKGLIALKDLERMALAHDFCWSDKELADMIYLFDTDGDGKLSLSDFHMIISRCNMLMPENS